jgi:outer membrane protein OmpA-like peptidoglycan-associated protein
VSYPGLEFTPQSTDATSGRFRSYEFPPDTDVTIEISHPLYETRSFEREIGEGQDGVRIRLQPGLSVALVYGTMLTPRGEPVRANIYLDGPSIREMEVDAYTSEYEVQIEPGEYTLLAVAEGYVSERVTMQLTIGRTEFAPALSPLPDGQVAALDHDAIRLDGGRISFVDDAENLEEQSTEILNQVAELLQTYSDLNVRVVAHTDDNGTMENTQRQAGIVLDYLTERGVARTRLTAEGAGTNRPIFPNISNRNRRRNRRVEFLFTQ